MLRIRKLLRKRRVFTFIVTFIISLGILLAFVLMPQPGLSQQWRPVRGGIVACPWLISKAIPVLF